MSLYFEDLPVGHAFTSARRTVTEADVVAFAGVSGDFNPLHTDAVAAAASGFGQRIAHGMLVLSIATGLRQQTGVFTDSHRGLLEIRSWKFGAPVHFGDTIEVLTRVVEARPTAKPERGLVVQAVEVRNQRQEVVQSGELVTLIATRSSAEQPPASGRPQ